MKRVSLLSLTFVAVGVAVAACQAVAGIESRTLDPIVDGCTLPTVGAGRVRFANLVPTDGAVDVCLRAAGGDFPRPVLRGGGTQCPAGFKYADVSAPLAAPTGKVDVKVVTAGLSCAAPALTQGTVDVPTDGVLTVMRAGGGGRPEAIVGLAESATVDTSNVRLRFVNAVLTPKPLRLGLVKEARLPTQVVTPAVDVTIPFGEALKPGASATIGKVDANGYIVTLPTAFNLAAAEDGTTDALLIANIPRSPTTYSLYAIGNPAELAFSPRGLLCQEVAPTSVLASCTFTALPTLSIDSFDVGLYGANAVLEAQRRPKIFEAMAARDTDLACLLEASRKEDRDALVAAGTAGQLRYAQTADTNLDTQPTDPKDQNGAVPPASTVPACGGSVPTKLVDDLFACVASKCSSKPGDASGVLASTTDCLSENCLNEFVPLLSGTPDERACYNCVIDNLVSQTSIAQSKLSCTTDARRPMAFGGQNPSVVLSRYPLLNQETYVLPSTGFRRVVLYSQVQLQQGATIDFYCAQLSSTLIAGSLPYSGVYGGTNADTGWEEEQKLQAQKVIAYVKQKSGTRPAIIAGDWHAATASGQGDGGAGSLIDVNPATLGLLRQAFTEATARGASPECTYCEEAKNPYNVGLTKGAFLTPTFLANFAADSTAEQSIIFNQRVVPIPNGTGMLSEYFGYNVRVLRP